MSAHLERARLLYGQSRYAQAEQELRLHLAQTPNDPEGHATLALCLFQRDAFAEALSEAKQSVGLGPDEPFPHFVHAVVLLSRDRTSEAAAAAREALRLHPGDPDTHGLLAAIFAASKEWEDSLRYAEQGLALDPEHARCLNARADALWGLGRNEDAEAQLVDALANDPENSETHESLGWNHLDKGNRREALDSFREALRLDPENESARAGMVEAMKARYPLYGIVLRYFLWMQKLSGKAQWAVVIGGWLLYRLVNSIGASNPDLRPFTTAFMILYFAFVWMTWLSQPLFNLVLRLHRFGRLALSPAQRAQSNAVLACLGLGLVSLGAWLALRFGPALLLALYFGLLLIPIASIWSVPRGRPRGIMTVYAAALGTIGILYIFLPPAVGAMLGLVFLAGVFLHGFVANFLIISGRRYA